MVNFTTSRSVPGDTLPPPVELRVTEVEDYTVFVSWTPPATAGSRLTEYQVYAVSDRDTQVKATQVSYITLRNLETDQDYNVTVTTVNSQGEGLPSNQITIRLQRRIPGEPALSITPVLARTVIGSVRSRSLLLQLPACGLFDRIAEHLRRESSQNFTVYVLMAEDTAVLNLSSDAVPDGENATYGYTDGGRLGLYAAARHLPVNECYRSTLRKEPIRDFGIFQVGSEEVCSLAQACNGLLRSNTTYRGRYMLMNDGTPILFSQWSESFTTRAVIPYQELQDTHRPPNPATITITLVPIILCLSLPLCLLGACYWRRQRTDQKSLVWRSLALGYLNPVQLSTVSATPGEVTADTSTSGKEGTDPQH